MALRDRLPFNLPFGQDPGRRSSPGDSMLGHTAPAPAPAELPMPTVGALPLGQSGRANFWGLPQPDELNQELIGPQGLRRLNEMYRTDAHVRRLVLAAWAPIVAGTWTLEPYGGEDTTEKDKQIAQDIWWLLNACMSPNFTEHLLAVGPLLLRSGFLACEQVGWSTVKRGGRTLLYPRKLDIRLPTSVWRFWQDDFGELTHIGQILPNRADVIIPASELVYYRLGAEGDNWQGTSLLRHAWKHWYLKDKLERIDAVGQERKAVGVPVVYPPQGASPQVKAQLERLLASLHTSEVAFVMMPGPKAGSQGQGGVPQEEWLLDVIQFDSSSGESIHASIDYHQTAIAASFLTDFLELGHHQVGARATAEVQEDPFLTAVNGALLPPVTAPLDRFIDRLRRLNWSDAEGSPKLKLTLHDEASLSEIAAYVTPLVQTGAMQVDPELEDYLRDRGGIPPANPQVRAARQKAAEDQAQASAQELAGRGESADEEPPSPAAEAAVPRRVSVAEPPSAKPQKKLSRAERRRKMLDEMAAESDRRLADIDREMGELTGPDGAAHPAAAGLIVQALDTGRLLLVQRAGDPSDHPDAYGKWEFPGGKVDDAAAAGDATPWDSALREWQEETGARLPVSAVHAGTVTTPDGIYEAHVMWVPREAALTLGAHDRHEVAKVAWREPQGLSGDPQVRSKAKAMLPAIGRLLHPARQLDQAARRTVSVDFDGVIHPRDPNGPHNAPTGAPIAGAAVGLRELAKDYQVVICTARKHLEPVRRWLKDNGLPEFAARVTNVKPPAIAYIDDHAEHFTGWSSVPGQVAGEARQLDAPMAPPNLRESTDPARRCGTCKMFDPRRRVCWSYEEPDGQDYKVGVEEVCDSWGRSPSGQRILDGPAPLSGGSEGAQGLQMVPEVLGEKACTCADGKADEDCPVHGARRLDAGEPDARWFDRLLSQGRLREAFDGARDHIEAACQPQALTLARQLAHQAANAAPMTASEPPTGLADVLSAHYAGMYALGHQTVTDELGKQRAALGRKALDDPADILGAGGASRLERARKRGEHSARNILQKVQERLGRDQISGLKSPPALQKSAEQAALAQLRVEALSNTAASVNDGRYDSAMSAGDVVGGVYTAVLDPRSCDPCIAADTGEVLAPDQAISYGPPNPDCEGADFCRCTIVWVLSSDPAALAALA